MGYLKICWTVLAVVLMMKNSAGFDQASAGAVKAVEMTAKKYEFSPNKIEVPVGTLVRFNITAVDHHHGFEIEGLKDSCVKIKKGESTTVEYKAEKEGTFQFKCCNFCGFGHRRMKGTISVK